MRKSKWNFGWRTCFVLAYLNYLFGLVNAYFFITEFSLANGVFAPIGFIAGTMAVISLGKKVKYI